MKSLPIHSFINMVQYEIVFHESHKGESEKGELFEEGYLAGLRSVERILRSIYESPPEDSILA